MFILFDEVFEIFTRATVVGKQPRNYVPLQLTGYKLLTPDAETTDETRG